MAKAVASEAIPSARPNGGSIGGPSGSPVAAANPLTVVLAIVQLGWDYVQPCLASGLALLLAAAALAAVLFAAPGLMWAVFGLWAFWIFALYEAMVVFRMLGLTYYCHAGELAWFRQLPKWGLPPRFGRIYSNS